MVEPKEPVLIGDNVAARAEWLTKLLVDYYNVQSLVADTFDKLCSLARGQTRSVIFLTDTLPYSYDDPQQLPSSNFSQLRGANRKAILVCILTGTRKTVPPIQERVYYVHLQSKSPSRTERDQLINDLQPLESVLPRATNSIDDVSRITRWSRKDRILRDQIQSLSPTRSLKDGEHHIFAIIRDCIDCREIKRISLESLSQGKSGAQVFHVSVTPKNDKKLAADITKHHEYVLKLSESKDLWKLQSEIEGYLQAKQSELYSRYKAHLPDLQLPRFSKASTQTGRDSEEFSYIASSLPWDAIFYDFLGGSLGECMSLETALISSADALRRKTSGQVKQKFAVTSSGATALHSFRLTFLDTLLSALCDIWYLNQKSKTRKTKQLWDRGNTPEQKYVSLPPYRLTARSKRWIEEFLDSDDAEMGERIIKEWGNCRARILQLINGKDSRDLGFLNARIPVTLTPVHGDLNANNVFLWLKHDGFPFLIDLPFFQSSGHVLQDFARLEVDIKLALMDKQKDSPPERLGAYDNSSQQLQLWQELEDRLLNHSIRSLDPPKWDSRGFKHNVDLTYRLVRSIRLKGQLAQKQACSGTTIGPVRFMDEYLPALLYHTVRAIAYPSLSVFKRLLAVYSAGSILRKLGSCDS